jgi:PTH1 family peptidyl-tRNA hydrolase
MGLFGRPRAADAERRPGTPFEVLVVGLGNPGKEYARTRHNVGQEVVDLLAARSGATMKAGRDNALVAETTIAGRRVVLAFPLTYMNESGRAVGALARRYKLTEPEQVVVVHDELDLAPATVRVKVGGGLAGHNGLRSITAHLKTQDFVRVRIGVGKPPSKERGAHHVLSKLPVAERAALDVAVQEAADAVEVILAEGPPAAMQRYNGR